MLTRMIVAMSLGLALTPSARAATPDPAMQKQIEEKCLQAATPLFSNSAIAVDPTGSQTYGMAIIFGTAASGNQRQSVICVFDKAKGSVELGSPMGREIVRLRRGKVIK